MAKGKQHSLRAILLNWIYQPHKYFLLVSLVFGFIYVFLVPPIQSPDESNHFHRSFHIAKGHLIGSQLEQNRLGGFLPSSLLDYSRPFENSIKDQTNLDNETRDSLCNLRLNKKDLRFIDFANVGYYAPTVYIPQALVLNFTSGLSLTPHFYLLLARISGLLFWLILGYYSLKIIPVKKELMLFLMCLPACLVLHSSCSGDTTSNSLFFLFISFWFLFSHNDKFKLDYITLGGFLTLILLLSINKFIYFPLAMLFIILPKHQFGKWAVFKKIIIIIIPLLVAILWANYANDLFISYDQYNTSYRDNQHINEGVNPGDQIEYILSHPLGFIKTAIISYGESSFATAAHYVGKFGWGKNYLPTWLIALLWIGILANTLFAQKSAPLNNRLQWMLIIVFVLITFGFTIGIYAQWSPVGNDRIYSLSGRYFISILPLLMFAFPQKKFPFPFPLWIANRVFIFFALSVMVLSIYLRYY